MSGDILSFLTDRVLLVLVLIVIAASILVLKIIEKRTRGREKNFLKDKFSYRERLNSIKRAGKGPEESLEELSSLSKQFFEEVFGSGKSDDFSQIREKIQNKNARSLCDFLIELNYAGRKIDKKEIDFLFRKFEELLGDREVSSRVKMAETEKAKKPLEFPSLKS